MKTLTIVLSCAALAAALPAAAQTETRTGSAFSSAYIGGSIGQSKFKNGCSDLPGGVSCDDKDTAWRLFAGYQFTPFLAAEVGYADLGKIDGSLGAANAELKANALDLVGVAKLPITSQLGVYGKAGAYRGETKLSSNVGVSGKDTDSGWTYGAGLQWDVIRNVGLRLEWQRYDDIGGDDTGKGDIDVVSLGAVWRFQ